MKSILKKIGIDLDKKHHCLKCGKPLHHEQKRCPECGGWNDCCAPDPERIKAAKERIKNQ